MMVYRTADAPPSASIAVYESDGPSYEPPSLSYGIDFSVTALPQQQLAEQQFDFGQTAASANPIGILKDHISNAMEDGTFSREFLVTELSGIKTQINQIEASEEAYPKLCQQAATLYERGHILTNTEKIEYAQIDARHKEAPAALETARKCEHYIQQKLEELDRPARQELASFRQEISTKKTVAQLEAIERSLQSQRSNAESSLALKQAQLNNKIEHHTEFGNKWRGRNGGDPNADKFVVTKRKEIEQLRTLSDLLQKKLDLVKQELTHQKATHITQEQDQASLAKIKADLAPIQAHYCNQAKAGSPAGSATQTMQKQKEPQQHISREDDLKAFEQIKGDMAVLRAQIEAQQHAETGGPSSAAVEVATEAAQPAVDESTIITSLDQAAQIAKQYQDNPDLQHLIKQQILVHDAVIDMTRTFQHVQPEGIANAYAGLHALEKVGRTMQSFAQGAGHGVLEFSTAANQLLNNPQKTAADLYNALATTIDNYIKQKEAIYNQCSGDFSRVRDLLRDAPDSVKKYYDALANQYRHEYATIQPTNRDVEAWVVGDILKDQQRADWWKSVKEMSSEEMAYHAGKFAAETILTEGTVRAVGGALQLAGGSLLYQTTKEGACGVATALGERAAQATESIAQAAQGAGKALADAAQGARAGEEVALAGANGAFKTAIKNPRIKQACEKIAANPPKTEILREAGVAAGTASKCREIILPKVKTFEQARNKALELLGDLGQNSKPHICPLDKSVAFDKVVGRMSADRKLLWRLDYDPVKGMHIHVEDIRLGKGINARNYVIPFEGTEETFKSLLKHLNK